MKSSKKFENILVEKHFNKSDYELQYIKMF